jgi:hypothetical protein
MANKLNSEFNYRYQCIGFTIWKKIQTLRNFLEGRKLSIVGEKIFELQLEAKLLELAELKEKNVSRQEIIKLEVELLQIEAAKPGLYEGTEKCKLEIEMLERLLKEAYEIAEPTRIPGYSDEDMFEVNEANEFTAMIAMDIYAEVLTNGKPSPAKLANAMSNPMTFNALKEIGLIPKDAKMLIANNDPLQIGLKQVEPNLQLKETLKLL